MLCIYAVCAFDDNYIWVLSRGDEAVVVDPGDAIPVQDFLAQRKLRLSAILLTHHHGDHVGGVESLRGSLPGLPIYGPQHSPVPGISHPLKDNDELSILGAETRVMAVPGHTLDHIAYWIPGDSALFCGDTLFAGGCGRVFEGTPDQMHASLLKIAALPDETRIYCAHEYTLGNLRFASAVEPDNAQITQRLAESQLSREAGKATVPSLLSVERLTNPFLRCHVPKVREAVGMSKLPRDRDSDVFAALRSWKNRF